MLKHIFLFGVCLQLSLAANLPADIVQNQCRLNDPDLNSCILRRAKELLPIFCQGISSAGIPTFDPLHLTKLEFVSNEGSLKLHAKLNQVTLVGHKTANIRNITLNPTTLRGFAIIQLPTVLMRSNMEVNGHFNDFAVNNHAIYNWKFDDVKYAFKYQLKSVVVNNEKYYSIDTLDLLSSAGNAHMQITSIDQSKQIQDSLTESAFNANPMFVLNNPEMKKFMSKSTASIYKNVLNYVLHKIPAKEFLIP